MSAPDSLIDLCTGTKHAAEIGVITKADAQAAYARRLAEISEEEHR